MSLLNESEKMQIMINADREFLDFFNHEAYFNSSLNKSELLEQLQNQQPFVEYNQYDEVQQEVYSEEELNFFFHAGSSNKKGSTIYLKSEEFLKQEEIETREKEKAKEKPLTTSDKLNMIFNSL